MTAAGADDPDERSADPPENESQRTTDGQVPRGRRRPVRGDDERRWQVLRTLVGLLLATWLLAALFSPPDPFSFLLALVPLWVTSVPLAWYLVYRDGYGRLRASGLYAPTVPAAQALAAFVVVALVFKVVSTVALDVLVDGRSFAVDAGVSVLALGVAYLLVYVGPTDGSDTER